MHWDSLSSLWHTDCSRPLQIITAEWTKEVLVEWQYLPFYSLPCFSCDVNCPPCSYFLSTVWCSFDLFKCTNVMDNECINLIISWLNTVYIIQYGSKWKLSLQRLSSNFTKLLHDQFTCDIVGIALYIVQFTASCWCLRFITYCNWSYIELELMPRKICPQQPYVCSATLQITCDALSSAACTVHCTRRVCFIGSRNS